VEDDDQIIVWPPAVILQNTRVRMDADGHWNGLGATEIREQYKNFNPMAVRPAYGPDGHKVSSLLCIGEGVRTFVILLLLFPTPGATGTTSGQESLVSESVGKTRKELRERLEKSCGLVPNSAAEFFVIVAIGLGWMSLHMLGGGTCPSVLCRDSCFVNSLALRTLSGAVCEYTPRRRAGRFQSFCSAYDKLQSLHKDLYLPGGGSIEHVCLDKKLQIRRLASKPLIDLLVAV
jgi:hypothetical protein